MSRRAERWRPLRVAGVVVVGAMLGLGLLPGSVGAVSGAESGYWYAGPLPGGSLTPPPNVPAHGLWVSSNPAGPVAIAALRLNLDSGDAPPVLLSLVVDGETPPNGASVYACRATSAWKA